LLSNVDRSFRQAGAGEKLLGQGGAIWRVAKLSRPVVFWISWRTLVDILADFSFVVVVIVIAARWVASGLGVDGKMVLVYAVILMTTMLPINAWLGLYQRIHYRTVFETRARAVLALHLAVPTAAVIFWLLPIAHDMRVFLEIAGLVGLFGILSNRIRLAHAKNMDPPQERLLVYGTGDLALVVKDLLEADRASEIVGFFAGPSEHAAKVPTDRVLPREKTLSQVVGELAVDEVIVAVSERRGGALPLRELLDCKLQGVRVNDLAAYFEQTKGQIWLQALYAGWLVFGDGFQQAPLRTLAKRTFDVIGAGLLLTLAAPVMILAAALIWLETGSPIFYRQERVGLNGKLFNVVKFRSMRTDAEKDGKPRWATAGDDRITRVGRVMRKTRIDELPQLFSVLVGDMSMVGPRPERPYFVDQLTQQIPFYAVRHCIKPGVTGWAQVRYHYGASVEDAAGKLQYDLYYVKNHTIMLDLVILFETVGVVVNAKGA
jgi:sugar transferase (PEP-CTERM system associated)